MFNYKADVEHMEHRKQSLLNQAKMQALIREMTEDRETVGKRWSRMIGQIFSAEQEAEGTSETE